MSDTAGRPDDQPSALHQATPLKSNQRALHSVLLEKNQAVARMYIGAIMARAHVDNPDYLSQACHSLRELIDNLPRYFDIPVERTDTLGNQVSTLHDSWKKEPRVRKGNDDAISSKFQKRLTDFFKWHEDNLPKRREVARTTIRQLDVSGRRLPAKIEVLHAQIWMEIREFFLQGTHHGSCTVGDFDMWLEEFETFMLGKAMPQTFDNADKIDALIEEGESDG